MPPDDHLTAEEIATFRRVFSDVETGRRFVCAIWKTLAIIGGIAGSVAMFVSYAINDWHWFRGHG